MNPFDPDPNDNEESIKTLGKIIIFLMVVIVMISIAMLCSGCSTMVPLGQDGKYGSIRLSAYWFPPFEYDQSTQPPRRIDSTITGFKK